MDADHNQQPPLPTAAEALREVYRGMTPRRRRHLFIVLAMMALGALFELLTIGAVIPFLALISGAADSSNMPAVRTFVEVTGAGQGQDGLVAATLLLAGVAIVGGIVRLVLSWVSQKFAFRLGHDLGVEIYSRMLRQPYSFYVLRNTSELIAGVEKVQAVIFHVILPAIQGFVAAVMALFIVALLVLIDPMTALIASLAMTGVYILVSLVARKLLRLNSRVIAEMQTQRVQQIQEGLGGIRDILIDQSHAVFEDNFRKLDNDLRNAQTMNVFVSSSPRFVVESAGIVLIALLALYMSGQPGGVVAAIPVLGALALGAQRLLPLIQLIYVGWSNFSGTLHTLLDVVVLMRAPVVESVPRDRSKPSVPFKRDIVFDRVSFRYGGSEGIALTDVDLTIAKGERIGLLGRTGSGKSTLLDLLMGLLQPSRGEILIDGAPLDNDTMADWQAQIAHVPQFIYLSDSSIASNIAFGEPAAAIDMERVRAAAGRACIAEFIEELPEGYATSVGERGVRLSGGQRQRIGIARALYKQANVLIFDEATSALDDETEAAVIRSLSDAGRDLTVVMIAHRLSTLAGCDRLIRLDGGRIVETGTYGELVGDPRLDRAISNG